MNVKDISGSYKSVIGYYSEEERPLAKKVAGEVITKPGSNLEET